MIYCFPVPQHVEPDAIDLNGIEYAFFGFAGLIFVGVCILFHLISAIAGTVRRKEHPNT